MYLKIVHLRYNMKDITTNSLWQSELKKGIPFFSSLHLPKIFQVCKNKTLKEGDHLIEVESHEREERLESLVQILKLTVCFNKSLHITVLTYSECSIWNTDTYYWANPYGKGKTWVFKSCVTKKAAWSTLNYMMK